MKFKRKQYLEEIKNLQWMAKNVDKQKESHFIREAVDKHIKSKLKNK